MTATARRFNRISLLPISFYCPQAAALSEAHGAGRAALMSKAVHAVFAGQPEGPELMAKLTEDELEEISEWYKPTTITIQEGDERVTLDYESAEKEVPLGLTYAGGYVDPAKSDAWMTKGTADFAWVREVWGARTAFVADMKKEILTAREGTSSLQLHAYAIAYASKVGAEAYVVGIWVLSDGIWEWMTDPPIQLDSDECVEILRRIRVAATNTDGEAVTGRHCRDCWGRLHCNEHVLPPVLARTELAPLALPDSITPENAARALLLVQALQDLIDPVKEQLKRYVNNGGTIEAGGKVWRPVFVRGRESVKLEAVRQLLAEMKTELGEKHPLVEKYGGIVYRGAGHMRFDWAKP